MHEPGKASSVWKMMKRNYVISISVKGMFYLGIGSLIENSTPESLSKDWYVYLTGNTEEKL